MVVHRQGVLVGVRKIGVHWLPCDRRVEVPAGAELVHELVRRDSRRIEEVGLGESGGEIGRIGEDRHVGFFFKAGLDLFAASDSHNLNIVVRREAAPSLIRAQQKLFPLIGAVLLLEVEDIVVEA